MPSRRRRRRRGARCGAVAVAARRRRRGRAGADGDPRDHLSDRDRVALGDEDLGDGAGRGRGQLEVDLVGGDLDDRVVGLDRLADLGVPFEDRPLADRLAGGGGDDVHDARVPAPAARRRRRRAARRRRRCRRSRALLCGCRRRVRRRSRCPRRLGAERRRRGAPPTAIRAITCPTVTVSPSATRISVTVPRRGGGELDVDLVGRDLDDRLVDLDRVADLGVPFEDGALGDRLSRRGGHDVHDLLGRRVSGHWLTTLAFRVRARSACRRFHSADGAPRGSAGAVGGPGASRRCSRMNS